MSNYKTYALQVRPRARFVSLPQSDTLFGHLCWAIRYAEGEDALRGFLAEFADSPPVLLSAAFPQGMLPVPVLPPLTRAQVKQIAHDYFEDNEVKATDELKARRDIKFLPLEQFRALANELTNEELARAVLNLPAAEPAWQETVVMRTAVDRITWSGREGALFDDRYDFFQAGARLTVWVRLRDDWDTVAKREWLLQRWQDVARSGFGGRLSTGAGQFTLDGLTPADAELPHVENANAFVTLASFVPRADDPTQGWWAHHVKRGKLGAHFSTNAAPGADTPHVWKKPLVMFLPGSTFVTGSAPRAWYGKLVPHIHPLDAYQEVAQYAYAFAVGVRVEGGAG